MHAFISKDLISVFESLISKGAVYAFTYLELAKIVGCTAQHHIIFDYFFKKKTTVLPFFCDAIPLYDIAEVITSVEGERKYVKDDKLIDMLVIHIENDGLKLDITVLEKMVDRIKGLVAAGEQQLPVVIFQFARVKNFREISQYLSVLSGKPAYVNEDEVLYSIERKTIKELRAAADVGFYVVLVTVLDVEPVLSWWYKSCVCSMKAEANADTYFCDGCNKDVNNVVDRYKLNLLVFYGTATTTFVVFDKETAALFGWTCIEMVKELNIRSFKVCKKLTILLGSTEKKLSNKILSRIATGDIFHEPRNMGNYLFIAEILVKPIGG
ncbi:hypothetical protein Ahy_A06g027233 [Arachis hypogaea]|uniref:Replication factor A C-terminal domain-containing protein n=1 Tax=Arachis hypogaea TaxID=3818 RepID=A0A445CN11_ARAHY|nr:hypothetical protein Ahy_A06g027233 [Arachis hypogaea]